jgi:hypothetical protein
VPRNASSPDDMGEVVLVDMQTPEVPGANARC